jgi:hypothetical protein
MSKRLLTALTVLLLATMVLGACGQAAAPAPTATPAYRLRLPQCQLRPRLYLP